MLGRIVVPKETHVLILGAVDTLLYVTKSTLQIGPRIRALKWGDYSGLPRWAHSNHVSSKIQRTFPDSENQRDDSKRRRRPTIVGFEDGGMKPQIKECGKGSRSWKRKGNGLYPGASRK